MSNSYRHTPVITQGPLAAKFGHSSKSVAKRLANKIIRQLPIEFELTNGAQYKRLFNSVNICENRVDYRFIDPNDKVSYQIFMK